MQNKVLVFSVSFCVLSGLSPFSVMLKGGHYSVSGFMVTAIASTTDYEINDKDHPDVPTSGGKPAFATKADVMISSAESFIESKDFNSAEEMAEKVTDGYPYYVPGWLILAYCRSLMGKYEDSNIAYSKALELGADRKVIFTRVAYNYMKLKSWEKARDSYLDILDEDENNIEVLKQLGYLEAKLKDFIQAQTYYQKALDIEPENAILMYALSRIMGKLGDKVQAKKLLEEAARVDPENPTYLHRLAALLLKSRDFERAVPYLERLVELEPENYSFHRNLGVAFYELGRKVEAKDEFERVASLGGNMKGLHAPLADCLRACGEDEEAVKFIKEGLHKDSQKAWLYSIWGKILENRRDYDGAIAKFNKAVILREAPWSAYASKQIDRQRQLKKRSKMISKQRATIEEKKH